MADENINPSNEHMQKLECPFTWKMDDISKQDNVEYHLNDDEELFPLLQLMRHLMNVYIDTKTNSKSEDILKGLKKCDEIMVTLKKDNHPEISADVVNYVLQSTKCFVFKQLDLQEKMNQVFSEIQQDWKMNSKERSTLIACKSICWSKYHRMGSVEAERFIRDAIEENPKCELWHFILAKNLRRERRDSTIAERPSAEEINSFVKAYNMSANPVYGIFLAQMYREMKDFNKARNIYNQVYDQNPTSTTLLLRLALGFIRLKDFSKAKECLDKVEAVTPNHGMYLHYRGTFHMNQRNYTEAAKFLKAASKDNNIPAEKQYLDCIVKIDRSFDVIQYLQDMVNRYSRLPKEQRQPLLLDLAMAYWLIKRDIPNAVKYFAMAVEINPEAKCLTNYFSPYALRNDEKNVYHLLKRDILLLVLRNRARYEKSCIEDAEKLQEYYNQYFVKNFDRTLNSFSRVNLRN